MGEKTDDKMDFKEYLAMKQDREQKEEKKAENKSGIGKMFLMVPAYIIVGLGLLVLPVILFQIFKGL